MKWLARKITRFTTEYFAVVKNHTRICSGSEARHLLESGKRLPGRKGKVVFARPWNFREFVELIAPEGARPFAELSLRDVTQAWLDRIEDPLLEFWTRYLRCGGIPKAVGHEVTEGEIDDDIFRVYEDWILGTWSKQRTPERSLRAFARRIVETLGSRVSYDAIRKGTDIASPNTVKTLLDLQEDHFALSVLPRWDPHKRSFVVSKLKKIYPLDPFIAWVWTALGQGIRRHYNRTENPKSLDECAFRSQLYRYESPIEPGFLYSERTTAEIDFHFSGTAIELKSFGRPSSKQLELLSMVPHHLVAKSEQLPVAAFLSGEKSRRFSVESERFSVHAESRRSKPAAGISQESLSVLALRPQLPAEGRAR